MAGDEKWGVDAHARMTESRSVVSGVFTEVSAGVLAAARSKLFLCVTLASPQTDD